QIEHAVEDRRLERRHQEIADTAIARRPILSRQERARFFRVVAVDAEALRTEAIGDADRFQTIETRARMGDAALGNIADHDAETIRALMTAPDLVAVLDRRKNAKPIARQTREI